MLTIFTTQLQGRLKDIAQNEELIEDAARLLCQSLIGDGSLYIDAQEEMGGVLAEALHGQDRFEQTKSLYQNGVVATTSPVDRALLVAPTSGHHVLLKTAKILTEHAVPFVVIVAKHESKELDKLADIIIDLDSMDGLVPNDLGNRIGHPASITALYCFIALQLMMKDILEEYL
ncbi:DUF2529 family protein [Alkalihalobacillus hemicellulosilyticus]|uniref:DUF2529 domain-containing protein n=1 Tax=Halalkalibacter hemicellulosilyticusJCM 9152 TaxID=1236971 RepID=W4QH71_9BACI|nr:DUF2529 family protein [Halalkalibacter hemicellulosilyticus]GAE31277.1 hypothetical protein JCM9152_2734 [Halalkalibacter hemicellulosilyticusJCM 9152]